MIRIPRIAVAAPHSGAGKTTVATALMAAFTRRGLRVQPFKVGPDFIDPGFHDAACGRKGCNLDGWMLSRAANLELFARASEGADLAVIEGVMGLFDGRDASGESGSTSEMAKWLGAPVVLVVDASAMARSAAAVVRGFEEFDGDLDVAAVLFNRVGGEKHGDLLREAVSRWCRAKMLGALCANEKIALPSRHLGLTLAAESLSPEILAEMAAWVESQVDLDALFALARERSGALDIPVSKRIVQAGPRVPIGVARDAAFCFYYQDNLDLLCESGAEIVEFSPITDRHLPAGVRGLYLGGGYPELHAAKLAQNASMIAAIREFARSGAPVYAECGGFMYLTEAIVDASGAEFQMVGLFPTRARMQPRLAALRYLEADDGLRGHEFRYSKIDPLPPEFSCCWNEGYRAGSVLAGYAHLHFRSSPEFARRFVDDCREWKSSHE